MIKRYCDKCGAPLNEIADRFLTASTRTRVDNFDLCEECFSEIVLLIKGKNESAEEPTEETTEETETNVEPDNT